MLGRSILFAGTLAMICTSASTVVAQFNDFRVETDISIPGQPKPIQQTLTLFKSGVAYDFSRETPEKITLIDGKRIVLLDAEREVQLRIDMQQFTAFMESARNEAASSPKLFLYLEDAKIVNFDSDEKNITVGDKVLRYEATLQEPPEAEMARLYAAFADTSAHLNAWRASSPPPFARRALNAAVAEQNALPEEITRTTFIQNKEHVVKCRLHSNWRLSKDDESQIAAIGKMLVSFEQVSVSEFFQQPDTVASKQTGNSSK